MADAMNRNLSELGRTGVYPSGTWSESETRIAEQRDRTRWRSRALAPASRDNATLAVGRLVFGGYFIYSGVSHFLNREAMVGYARSKNVPMPEAAVLGSGAMLVAGGLSLATGFRPKLGAALVSTFLAGVSPVMHRFWTVEDQSERAQEMINFTKNMALIGGAAFAASVPEPWPLSPGQA